MERRFGVNASDAASEASIDSRGNVYLGQTIGWSTLLESLRVLLVAEAGAGKTHECAWLAIKGLGKTLVFTPKGTLPML